MKIYKEKSENETLRLSDYQRLDEFDSVIIDEKWRIKKVKTFFILIDITVAIGLFCESVYSKYQEYIKDNQEERVLHHWFSSSFEIFIGIILGLSAIYLTRTIKTLTGKEANTCLLVWHIINVFLMALLTILEAITIKMQSDKVRQQYTPCE